MAAQVELFVPLFGKDFGTVEPGFLKKKKKHSLARQKKAGKGSSSFEMVFRWIFWSSSKERF